MRALACLFALCLFIPSATAEPALTLVGPNRSGMVEGEIYTIQWDAEGLQSVSVVAEGTRTPRGRMARGSFQKTIAQAVPATEGGVDWTVPWLDAGSFTVKVKGYDTVGRVVATAERAYSFRPAVLANRTADGLYLDLSRRVRQRLYVQKNLSIQRVYLTSSSENYFWQPPDRSPARPHDHAGVFRVSEKKRRHWSSLYDVLMPFAMRYHQGHFIHATSENLYDELGGPASHGCNRLTRRDAEALYRVIPLGTRVEVIGPAG